MFMLSCTQLGLWEASPSHANSQLQRIGYPNTTAECQQLVGPPAHARTAQAATGYGAAALYTQQVTTSNQTPLS